MQGETIVEQTPAEPSDNWRTSGIRMTAGLVGLGLSALLTLWILATGLGPLWIDAYVKSAKDLTPRGVTTTRPEIADYVSQNEAIVGLLLSGCAIALGVVCATGKRPIVKLGLATVVLSALISGWYLHELVLVQAA